MNLHFTHLEQNRRKSFNEMSDLTKYRYLCVRSYPFSGTATNILFYMEEYYYLNSDNQRIGPFTLDQLLANHITGQTLIWRAGLAQWTNAMSVPEVAARLNPNNADAPQPAAQAQRQATENYFSNKPCPPTNLVWGIIVTILCCLPLGIVAIYKSSQVERNYYNGNYEAALKASNSALNWCIASMAICVLVWMGYFGLILTLPFSLLFA